MSRILVALSGGVDSAVAALLLKQKGHAVTGLYMRTWMHEASVLADCPWKEDMESARQAAAHIGIEFQVQNMMDAYSQHVVHELVEGYRHGLTPNPDILCNQHVKFGVLLEYAMAHGYDYLATGHYCRKSADNNAILEGLDPLKDQSYFLAFIPPAALTKVLFPIGELTKPQVRSIATAAGLPNAQRKDSQGICFLGKVPINDFLKAYIPDAPGPIMNLEGKLLGTHQGLHRYTLGQRHGIGIPSNADFEHYVVVRKDYTTHTLYLAFERPLMPELYTSHIRVTRLHFLTADIPSHSLLARPRYRDPATPITLEYHSDHTASVRFESPQRALAAGQVIAFYKDSQLIGGAQYL